MGHFAVIGYLLDMTDVAVGDATELEATVRRAAEGDESALARLVVEHHASMTRVAFVIVGDPTLAADAVQAGVAAARRLA
jgi:DNA-directed RNA polymerase specialized sigma24 family protein